MLKPSEFFEIEIFELGLVAAHPVGTVAACLAAVGVLNAVSHLADASEYDWRCRKD